MPIKRSFELSFFEITECPPFKTSELKKELIHPWFYVTASAIENFHQKGHTTNPEGIEIT